MKITFVFDGLQYGGIERVGIEYIKLLKSRGYEVQVINLNPRLCSIEKEIPIDIIVKHIAFPRGITPARYKSLCKRGIIGKLVEKNIRWMLNVIGKVYRLFYEKILPDTDLVIAFAGHFNDLTFVSTNYKNKKKIAWVHGSQYSYKMISDGFFDEYKKIKNLVCLSYKDDDKVAKFNISNCINKIKIYNPINISSRPINAEKISWLKNNYGKFILMVGRLDKDKDQETLIRAVQRMYKKYGIENKLVLVGDGSEKARLEQVVKELGIGNLVIFEGLRTDVQNYYMAASIYAHSSPAEGLPTVLLEAMYYNCPIVSTNSEPGTQEILQDNCGLISAVGDIDSLADNIYRMYTDESCMQECVNAGKRRIQEFMPEQIMKKFEKFIESI